MSPSLSLVCCPHQVWTVLPLHLNLEGNPVDNGRISPSSKKSCLFPTSEKTSLQNRNFHVITQYKLHLKLFIAVASFFLTSDFMYTYLMPVSIKWWLLNLIFSMRKALNGQNSSTNNFHPASSPLFNVVWKPCFSYYLFPTLLPPFFISNFINFFWPHFSWDCIAYDPIKYNRFQISENKPETPYVML